MFPVINIPELGLLVTIGGLVKQALTFLINSGNFLIKHTIAVIAGSKIWATAAFLAFALTIIGLMSQMMSFLISKLATIVVGEVALNTNNALAWEFGVVLQMFPKPGDLQSVFDALMWSISFTASIFIADKHIAIVKQAVEKFSLLMRSWKT